MCAQIAERKAEILAFLRRRSPTNQIAAPPIGRRACGEPAPLSFAQERLWFLQQLEPESAAYNVCRASRLLGNLSSPLLKASLNAIVSRHETLRTALRLVEGKPVPVVQPAEGLPIDFVDLRSLQESERNASIQRQIAAEALRPFNLESGALLRCALLRVDEQEHILVLITHHSAADAWSMGILTRELWTLYDAFSNGRPCPLQPLPVQYSDFAVWQRDWLQGDVLESQLGYWKERLKDLSVLNLPTDRPRQPRQSFRGARVTIELPDELTSALNEMSHRFAVTPFMILLAAFQVLLYRYMGQEDVVVGSPIANRRRPELEGLIGFFVNTLVLRADLSEKPSFTELLFHVRDLCVGADANQDLPFEKLVQELQPERDPSRNPLFQVMFVLQNATRPFTGIPGLQIEPLEVVTTQSPFDLSLFLRERAGKYVGYIEYSTDLFDHDRIERMAGHYRTLLDAIVSDPDQSAATLPILTEAERHRILVEWNDTAADYPKDKCIHQLFEEQVERTPEAIAVEFANQQITYRELNRRANQLAHYLISLGIGPEKLVGICLDRSIEMVVGLLGILKAGGAYVPLDPAYPKARIEFMLQDSQCSVLLTQEKWLGSQLAFDGSHKPLPEGIIVYLDRDFDEISRLRVKNPLRHLSSDNLAYVIYTSGSTGTPKGVAIEHRNTMALLSWAKKLFAASELNGVLASTSICFDLSVFELFVPLSWGGRVVLVENAVQLYKTADANGVTLINTVPSVMRALLTGGLLPDSVRVINLAGEPLRTELVKKLYKLTTIEKVYDLYGPSETTTYSTATLRKADGPATIGRPISNTQVYILDSNLQPVPIGVAGEIHIGGSGVARGYLNRVELTAEKFIANPFDDHANYRLYRTGDKGRYLPDGNIEFLGRVDNQVKIRGYRIELEEIAATLNQHPAVEGSVVVAHARESSREKDLAGYVVLNQTSIVSPVELRAFLCEKLPEYMLPSLVTIVDALPLNSNGKVDRSKLPLPVTVRESSAEDFRPRREIEELVTNVWRDVLQIETVGVNDNFFELGGHSLLATQVIARLSGVCNREVPLKTLFDAPTVCGIAERLETLIRAGDAPELPPIIAVPRDRPLPLSINQEHLWNLHQMMPATHLFNMPYVYHLSGTLNVEALGRALTQIVRRHEALRSVFIEINGCPMQIVKPEADFQLHVLDLRGFSPAKLRDAVGYVIWSERERPFNLTLAPLLRTQLVQLNDQDYLLLFTLHHIISDEWSMRVFGRELATLYEGFSERNPLPLPDPAIQCADFACWERWLLDNGLLREQLTFWKEQLAGPLPTLEFHRPRKAKRRQNFQASRHPINFDAGLLVRIKALARQENCTPFVVAIAAVNIVLHLYTGLQDIRIGTLVANRSRKEAQSAIGHFLNTVVLRTQVMGDMTIKHLLAQVRSVTTAAYAHQELPYEKLARVFEEERNISRGSLFQILFNYHYASSERFKIPGLKIAPWDGRSAGSDLERVITSFDLIFNLRETSTKLTGAVNYRTDIFDPGEIETMVGRFCEILVQMVLHPERRISDRDLSNCPAMQ